MRFAVIVVTIVVVSSPSQASPSCMTQAEARQKFSTSHLYWHGPNHCWDATPGRRRLAQRAKLRERQPVEREAAQEKKSPQQTAEKPSRWAHEPRWREAMSKMLPEDAPLVQTPAPRLAGSLAGIEPIEAPAPRVNWRDRWVEVAQRVPPVVDRSEPADLASAAGYKVDPMVTPARVMLAFLAILLTLAAIELLFRTMHRGWRC
jgi:hypothetical protein